MIYYKKQSGKSMKELDLEIKEEDLEKYVEDFSKFASRKNCRQHKKKVKRRSYLQMTESNLNSKSKRELAIIYYKLKKKLVDPSLRTEFFNRLQLYSKQKLTKKIIEMSKMEEKKIM